MSRTHRESIHWHFERADVDRQIGLARFLSDEPDSRTEHVFGDLAGKSKEELQALLVQEIAAAKELSSGKSPST